ncbi:hypothetical protein HK096_001410, partial [Nowakowskiella sp. JEL0078]
MWEISEIEAFYKQYAEHYDDDIRSETYPAPFVIGNWILAFLAKRDDLLSSNTLLDVVKESQFTTSQNVPFRVLDVGCGT